MKKALAEKLMVRSDKLGLKEQAVVDRAVSLLWKKSLGQDSLERETSQWEALSDEAWQKIKD